MFVVTVICNSRSVCLIIQTRTKVIWEPKKCDSLLPCLPATFYSYHFDSLVLRNITLSMKILSKLVAPF